MNESCVTMTQEFVAKNDNPAICKYSFGNMENRDSCSTVSQGVIMFLQLYCGGRPALWGRPRPARPGVSLTPLVA